MGWLSGWRYRRAVEVVEKSGSDLTDFQVRIELNSSNFDFSKANVDGSDIRFTTDDGETLIPHWIESWDGSNQVAVVWVKVPYIPANGTATIYMYYGNNEAADASDGDATFEFFDDFDGAELDTSKWTPNFVNTVNYEVLNGELRIYDATKSGSTYWIYDHTDTGSQIKANAQILDKMVIEWKQKMETQSSTTWLGEVGVALCKSDNTIEVYAPEFDNHAGEIRYLIGYTYWFIDGSSDDASVTIADNTYYVLSITKNGNNYVLKAFDLDGNIVNEFSASTTSDVSYIAIAVGAYGGYDFAPMDIDWVRVRKYAEQEPIVQVGDEETSWLYGWSYRRAITITDQSGSDLTDFQVKITLDASNFDAWDKVNADGSDLRFTDSDGTTLLPYWIESFDAVNKQAIVWVKVPSIPANGTATIYMYYGNSEAADAGDPESVFEFFDDFDTFDTNKWSTEWLYGGSYSVSEGVLTIIAHGNRSRIHSTQTFSRPLVVEVRVQKRNNDIEFEVFTDGPFSGGGPNAGSKGYQFVNRIWVSPEDIAIEKEENKSWALLASTELTVSTGWHIGKAILSDSDIIFDLDGTQVAVTDTSYTSGYVVLSCRETDGAQIAFDWVRVRKYAEQEPTVSVSTTEESAVVNVSGVVQLPDGTPVGGVWVVAVRQVDNKIDAATISNQDGSFTLTVLKYKKYSIITYPPNDTTKNGDIKAHIQT